MTDLQRDDLQAINALAGPSSAELGLMRNSEKEYGYSALLLVMPEK